jgi:hypothetical protein
LKLLKAVIKSWEREGQHSYTSYVDPDDPSKGTYIDWYKSIINSFEDTQVIAKTTGATYYESGTAL